MLVTPGVLLTITILSWAENDLMGYGDYTYPDGVQAMGWVLEMAPLAITFLFPIYTIFAYNKKVRGIFYLLTVFLGSFLCQLYPPKE